MAKGLRRVADVNDYPDAAEKGRTMTRTLDAER